MSLHFNTLDELIRYADDLDACVEECDIAAACGSLEVFFAHESAPYWCCWLARESETTFPQGEEAIARSAISSVGYATDVLRARFQLGEAAIAKCAYHSGLYDAVFKGTYGQS